MRIIPLLLLILLFINLVSLILYYIKYDLIHKNRDFKNTLKEKIELEPKYDPKYKYESEFNSVFGDSSSSDVIKFLSFLFCLVFLIIAISLQLCKTCWKIGRSIISLILITPFLFYAYYALKTSFKTKNILNLKEEEIYVFDDEFNNELKEKIQIMYERKIYMIAFSLIFSIGIVIQFILLLIDIEIWYSNEENNDNSNVIGQDVVVYQETDRQKNNLEVAENTKKQDLGNENSNNN